MEQASDPGAPHWRLRRAAIVIGGLAAVALVLLGIADRLPAQTPAELVSVAQGEATTTTVLPTIRYVPSASPSVKATFFGKN